MANIINEKTAKIAHEVNSMSAYKEGTATSEYNSACAKARKIADARIEKYPDEAERIEYLYEKYCYKLCNWYNTYYSIEAMCPSVLVCGAGNFPTAKKNKQNSRRNSHMKAYQELEKLLDRISKCGNDAIKSGDINAIVKLETKIEKLTDLQERMKAVNAYYRKNKTCVGCEEISEQQAKQIDEDINDPNAWYHVPFAPYQLQNNNAEIHRLKKRLEDIKAVKDKGNTEQEIEGVDGVKVVENADIMRVQIIFDDIPSPEIRTILKSNGFKWAPSQKAWQRTLNTMGKYSARDVIEKIKQMQKKTAC